MVSLLLVILSDLDVEVDWTQLQDVMRDTRSIHTASIYTGRDATSNKLVLFCDCNADDHKRESGIYNIMQRLGEAFRIIPEIRVYKPIATTGGDCAVVDGRDHLSIPSHIMVFNAMTPNPPTDQQFNDWYSHEHIPLLQLTQTWISSQRFMLVSSTTEQTPQYLALHKWENTDVFNTEEYKIATNTPWRTAVIAEVVKKERMVLVYQKTLDLDTTSLGT